MMKQSLREKNHSMHLLLQKVSGDIADFRYTSQQLSDLMESEVHIIDKNKTDLSSPQYNEGVKEIFRESLISEKDQERLYQYTQSTCNVAYHEKSLMIVPIVNMGERLGTMVYLREENFNDDDFLLGEYGGTIAAVQIMREINRKAENETRKKILYNWP